MRPDDLRTAERLESLEEATRWAWARGVTLVEIVTQDEYTHDVVFLAGAGFLVFDTT